MRSVPERDWKAFKKFHPIALDRFCQRVLDEVTRVMDGASKTPHERYLAIYKIIRDRDKEVAQVFNDYRRSTAFFQIAMMHNRGLLTEEEFQEFSPETRHSILDLRDILES